MVQSSKNVFCGSGGALTYLILDFDAWLYLPQHRHPHQHHPHLLHLYISLSLSLAPVVVVHCCILSILYACLISLIISLHLLYVSGEHAYCIALLVIGYIVKIIIL